MVGDQISVCSLYIELIGKNKPTQSTS